MGRSTEMWCFCWSVLSLACVAAGSSGNETMVARVAAVKRWLDDPSRPPPTHWAVTSKYDLGSKKAGYGWTALKGGEVKSVFATTYKKNAVVVKTAVTGEALESTEKKKAAEENKTAAQKKKKADWRRTLLHAEIVYLEHLAGEPGVPKLYGGWWSPDGDRLSYVVQHAGERLARGKGMTRDPYKASLEWTTFAKTHPLHAARALLRCFESFAEVGGYFLDDFRPAQFTFDPPEKKWHPEAAGVYLVDGPFALAGDSLVFAREYDFPVYRHDAQRASGDGATCSSNAQCPHTPSHHCCCGFEQARDVCGANFDATMRGAPEARGTCVRGTCAPITTKTHVHDVANTAWALPLVAEEGAKHGGLDHAQQKRLHRLRAWMSQQNPDDRPTFARALEYLDTGK